jgi:hypothetical protein
MLVPIHWNEEMPGNLSGVLALQVIQLVQIIQSDAELTYSVFTLLDQTSSQLVWLNAIECYSNKDPM